MSPSATLLATASPRAPAGFKTAFGERLPINNVVNLSREGKPVVVYIAPKKQFITVKAFDDLKGVLAQGEAECVDRVVSEFNLEDLQHRIAG